MVQAAHCQGVPFLGDSPYIELIASNRFGSIGPPADRSPGAPPKVPGHSAPVVAARAIRSSRWKAQREYPAIVLCLPRARLVRRERVLCVIASIIGSVCIVAAGALVHSMTGNN
jgi:hypothetical protein